jgi:serine/threonine protein kinase
VPGILLELIEGINLEEIDPSSFNLNNVFNDALRIINQCGELGVLNHDIRLSNFIVRPRGSVVMIDFAQARVRRGDETDLDWKRMKWDEDEEGCVGAAAAKKFGWQYIRSLKYCPPFERESY